MSDHAKKLRFMANPYDFNDHTCQMLNESADQLDELSSLHTQLTEARELIRRVVDMKFFMSEEWHERAQKLIGEK